MADQGTAKQAAHVETDLPAKGVFFAPVSASCAKWVGIQGP